jgi:hypothetical protein
VARDRLLKQVLRERFVITLKTGETFDGLLDDWDDRTIVFVDSYAVSEKARIPANGKMYFPRDQVAYLQRPA